MQLEPTKIMLTATQITNKMKAAHKKEDGFSLVEVIIAMLIMTVMFLGTLSVFTYAVKYNRGNNLRSQALTILQKEAETYRSMKFVPTFTDPELLANPSKPTETATSADGTVFLVTTTVDNDPSTDGIHTSETLTSGKACTLKEIKITVTPQNKQSAWETAIVTDLVIQRVRGN